MVQAHKFTTHTHTRARLEYRVAQTNWHHCFVRLIYLYHMLTNFQNYFTVRIRRKSIVILSLKIPQHLKCVSTLQSLFCEMSSVLKVKQFLCSCVLLLRISSNVAQCIIHPILCMSFAQPSLTEIYREVIFLS